MASIKPKPPIDAYSVPQPKTRTSRVEVILNRDRKDEYTLSANAVELLPIIKEENGYIKLTTKVNSNFTVGDIAYICALSGGSVQYSDTTYVLDNMLEVSGCTEWFYHPYISGYEVLSINNKKNEIIIDRIFDEKLRNKKIYNHFITKIAIEDIQIKSADIDCAVFKNFETTGTTIDIDLIQGIILTGTSSYNSRIHDMEIMDKYDYFYKTMNTKDINDVYSIYYSRNNNGYGYTYIYNQYVSGSTIYSGYFYNCRVRNCIINGGAFIGCLVYGSTINDGLFSGSTLDNQCDWIYGIWHYTSNSIFSSSLCEGGASTFGPTSFNDGIWNCGTFSGKTWFGGIFNNGKFTDSDWRDGVFNGGRIERSTWSGGTFNNGYMSECEWNGGTFNNGEIMNSNWYNGDFINGTFSSSKWYNGNFYNGTFNGNRSGDTLTFDNEWYNGNFYNGTFNKSIWYDGIFYNGSMNDSYWVIGTFNNGIMTRTYWVDGTFNNGSYFGDLSGITVASSPYYSGNIRWENGTFNNGTFTYGYWENGNFNNGVVYESIFRQVNWKNGTFNGNLIGPYANTGYLGFTVNWSGGTFNNGSFGIPTDLYAGSVYMNWYNGNFYGGSFYNDTVNSYGGWFNGNFYNGNFYGDWYNGQWFGGYFYSPPANWKSGGTRPDKNINKKYNPTNNPVTPPPSYK